MGRNLKAGFIGFGCTRGLEELFHRFDDEARTHKAARLGIETLMSRAVHNNTMGETAARSSSRLNSP